MNEFHHSKCSSKKQYVNALQLLYTAKRMLHNAIINKTHYTTKLELLSSISDIIIHTQMLYYETQNNSTYMTSGIKQNHTISLITSRHLTLHSSLLK